MFSSNQILDISCEQKDLSRVIKFAVGLDDEDLFIRHDGRLKMAFSEPIPGVYAIGRGSVPGFSGSSVRGHSAGKGWVDYPFDYDPDIVAGIINQWIQKQPEPKHTGTDGSEHLGVRVRCLESMGDDLPHSYDLPNWDWFSCILLFTPIHMAYHK